MSHILSDEEFVEIVQYFVWTFAKTMPEDPHEYIVRDETVDDDTYIEMFNTIETRGEPGDWKGKQYKYLRPGDGHKYWKMTDDIKKSVIINRAYDDSLPKKEYSSIGPANHVLCPLVEEWIDVSECDENRGIKDESVPLKYKQKRNWRDICDNCTWSKHRRIEIDWADFDKYFLKKSLHLSIGGTEITFCINKPDGYKEPDFDGGEWFDWCLVSIIVKSRYFNFDRINDELLTVGEVSSLYHHFNDLLEGKIAEVCRLNFIEPDLEFMLYPKYRFTTPGVVEDRDRPILYDTQEISVAMAIYLPDTDAYYGQAYSIKLNRDNVRRFKEYLRERLQTLPKERYGELL